MKTRPDNAPFTPVAVQPKLDGVGVVATRDGLTSTQGKPIPGQKFLRNRLRPFFALNPKAELKGELYRHGKPFEDVLSKVRTGKGGLQLHVFPDGTPGQKLPFPVAGIRRVRTDIAETPGQLKKLTKANLKQGYEGSIVRDASGGVAKVKPFRDAEFPVVSSAVGPKGKHGVLTLKSKSGTFKAQAPLSVATSAQPGQPVTVTYSQESRRGVPRSGVVKAVRDFSVSGRPDKTLSAMSRTINFRSIPRVAPARQNEEQKPKTFLQKWVPRAVGAGLFIGGATALRKKYGKQHTVPHPDSGISRPAAAAAMPAKKGKKGTVHVSPDPAPTPPKKFPPLPGDWRKPAKTFAPPKVQAPKAPSVPRTPMATPAPPAPVPAPKAPPAPSPSNPTPLAKAPSAPKPTASPKKKDAPKPGDGLLSPQVAAFLKRTRMSRVVRTTNFNLRNEGQGGQFTYSLSPTSAYRKATGISRWARRTGDVTSDLTDIATGRKKDPGQKRFYEKSWFRNAAVTLPIAGAFLGDKKLGSMGAKRPEWAKKHLPKAVNARHDQGLPYLPFARKVSTTDFKATTKKNDSTGRKAARVAGYAAAGTGLVMAPAAYSMLKIPARAGLAKAGVVSSKNIHGKMAADYITASQRALNIGPQGKIAGRVIESMKKRPAHTGFVPSEKHTASMAQHLDGFRSSHRGALSQWAKETEDTMRFKGRKNVADKFAKSHAAVLADMDSRVASGSSEGNALRGVANDAKHQGYFRSTTANMGLPKSPYTKLALTSPGLVVGGAATVVAARKREKESRDLEALIDRVGALVEFDLAANLSGWDVRDPRGKSARVFAPGSKRRDRREKEWGETMGAARLMRNVAVGTAVVGVPLAAYAGHRYAKSSILRSTQAAKQAAKSTAGDASKLKIKVKSPKEVEFPPHLRRERSVG